MQVCKYMHFQSSARRPQARARIWCRGRIEFLQKPCLMRSLPRFGDSAGNDGGFFVSPARCENRANAKLGLGFESLFGKNVLLDAMALTFRAWWPGECGRTFKRPPGRPSSCWRNVQPVKLAVYYRLSLTGHFRLCRVSFFVAEGCGESCRRLQSKSPPSRQKRGKGGATPPDIPPDIHPWVGVR